METAEDIVRKMRETVSIIADKESEGSDILSVWSILSTFADRIEKAAERDILAEQAEVIVRDGVSIDKFNSVVLELSKIRDERDKLKAALMPVLKCVSMGCTIGYDGKRCEPCCAVREAQRIYREGGAE